MSNELFPLAALGAYIDKRSPKWDSDTKLAQSGKRSSSSWALEPLVGYTIKQESVRSDIRFDYQQLLSFVGRHNGGLDSFLLQDAEDATAADPTVAGGGMCFGIGNGSQTAFQLQRRLTGTVFDNLPGGPWRSSSGPRTNLLFSSQAFSSSFWTYSTGVTFAINATLAPDNTPANVFVYDGTGSAGGVRFSTNPAAASGPYCGSIWLRADAPVTVRIGTASTAVLVCNLTTSWQRFYFLATSAADFGVFSAAASNAAFRIYAWGAQSELDIASTGIPTKYIPTTTTQLTQNPQLWPAFADSFLPVYELNGPASIFRNDYQGNVQLFPWARTNLVLSSQAFSTSFWTKTSLSAGAAVLAPDGTTTAIPHTATAGGATMAQTVSGLIAGQSYTAYIWLLCAAGGTLKISAGATTSSTLTLNSGWQRFAITFVATGTTASITIGASASWSNGEIVQCWGAQVESGLTANSYIPTTTAAVTVTDYTLTLGQVTLAVPPLLGAVLSWLGSYYIRVRLDDSAQKGLDLQRIVAQMWSTGLQLISVVP